jgi:hypothetical protein
MSRRGKKKKNVLDLNPILDTIPETIDFGYSAVASVEKRSFVIFNTTPIVLKYSVKIAEDGPFELNQESGTIPVHGRREVTISYAPEKCEVVIATLIVTINEEQDKVVKISAISKYPFLCISDTTVDFKELLVGKSEK